MNRSLLLLLQLIQHRQHRTTLPSTSNPNRDNWVFVLLWNKRYTTTRSRFLILLSSSPWLHFSPPYHQRWKKKTCFFFLTLQFLSRFKLPSFSFLLLLFCLFHAVTNRPFLACLGRRLMTSPVVRNASHESESERDRETKSDYNSLTRNNKRRIKRIRIGKKERRDNKRWSSLPSSSSNIRSKLVFKQFASSSSF